MVVAVTDLMTAELALLVHDHWLAITAVGALGLALVALGLFGPEIQGGGDD